MRFRFLVVGVALMFAPSLAAQTADEAAVNSRVDDYYEAVRAGDAESYQGFYHENGVRVIVTDVVVGRANMDVPDGGGTPMTFTRHATTVFSPTVAVTHGSFEIEGGPSGHSTMTLVKEGNEWFIAAVQYAEVQAAQSQEAAAQSLVGAWTLEQTELTGGDNPGTRTGQSGLMIFTETHYSWVQARGTGRDQTSLRIPQMRNY